MSRFGGIGVSEHPTCIVLVMCDRIILDQQTQKRSLIDIFDTVYVKQLPGALYRMSIFVSLLRGTAEQSEVHLGLFSPSGVAVIAGTLNITDWGQGQMDSALSFEGVKLEEVGTYDLRVFVADSVLAQRRLVVQMPPEPPEAEAEFPTP